MTRSEFLHIAGRLQEFVLDSIEDFVTGAGIPFAREAFLQETSIDFRQMAVEALLYGSEDRIWDEEDDRDVQADRRVA